MAVPNAQGHFGLYGGRFVPETLMHPLWELEAEYIKAQHDPAFQRCHPVAPARFQTVLEMEEKGSSW